MMMKRFDDWVHDPMHHHSQRRFIMREVLLVGGFALLYFYVRGLMDAKETLAKAHAVDVIHFEQKLGIFVEPDIQQWFRNHVLLIDFFNSVYIYGHWPVLIGTLFWLVFRHRDEYPRYRNALVISGCIGVVIFATYPVAPPRMMTAYGFWDSVTARTNAYRVLQPPALTNPYAAIPSLHFGWNLLMGIAWVTNAETIIGRIFGWVVPVLMFMAIVITANHLIIDGVIGATLTLSCFAFATWLARRHPRPTRESPATAPEVAPSP